MVGLVPLQALGHQWVHREPVARETGRRRRDLAKGHRAPALERGDPSVGRGGDDGAQHAFRDLAAVLAHK
jgi:hypothetical protein